MIIYQTQWTMGNSWQFAPCLKHIRCSWTFLTFENPSLSESRRVPAICWPIKRKFVCPNNNIALIGPLPGEHSIGAVSETHPYQMLLRNIAPIEYATCVIVNPDLFGGQNNEPSVKPIKRKKFYIAIPLRESRLAIKPWFSFCQFVYRRPVSDQLGCTSDEWAYGREVVRSTGHTLWKNKNRCRYWPSWIKTSLARSDLGVGV